ncbi:hypothetical protein PAHAL_1G397400 [Panicum hallii]|uniref:Myb/SANT-like domain-containing protein n=1 Tax=Panicum hallii TaxID=206008 RepID=A0A2T8KXU9_9POAL|nr:hypothetical protein PAHAL_1G397400 [Panicum hallii]
MGYCNRGQMSKWGWQNLTEKYFKRTKLVHDNVTFGNKLRALKKEWRAIRDLQIKETGLGRSSDGSVNASEQWWQENSQDQQKELKHGLPVYLPEMDKMFQGVCVTGETSYVPGRRKGPQTISSDEDEDGGDTTPQSTPHSSGSKRSSSSLSTRSTGSSPIKKSRSPAVRAMQSNMRELNIILENRIAAQNQIWADRQKREEQLEEQKRARRKRVREMARQLGVVGDSRLWVGVLKLVRSDEDMESFEEADEEGRKCILAHLSGVGN